MAQVGMENSSWVRVLIYLCVKDAESVKGTKVVSFYFDGTLGGAVCNVVCEQGLASQGMKDVKRY